MVLTDQVYRHTIGDTPPSIATKGWLAHLSEHDNLPYPMTGAWPVTTACGKVLEGRGTWSMIGDDAGFGGNGLAKQAEWVICLDCVMALLQ